MKVSRFTPITAGDYHRFQPFFSRQHYPLCVYSLPSIIVWHSDLYQPYGAVIDDDTLALGIEFTAVYEPYRHLILPVSPTREQPPAALAEIARRLGFSAYWFVPRDYIDRAGEDRVAEHFSITEEPGLSDYVYRTEDLADLKGNRYAKKRNLINQFRKSHVAPGRVRVAPITPADRDACLRFLDKWCEIRRCDSSPDEDLTCERRAARNSLALLEEIDMRGLLLRIDGEVCAFGIASTLTPDMGVLHFEKALPDVKGLYQYFDSQCAGHLFSGLAYINKESDMDQPGLARAKASYHPVMRVPAFRLSLKDDG